MYTGSALPVGWARIPLFQRDLRQGDNTGRDSVASIDIHWLLQNGDFKFTLHPGDVPEVSTHPSSPTVPTQSDGKFTPRRCTRSVNTPIFSNSPYPVWFTQGLV